MPDHAYRQRIFDLVIGKKPPIGQRKVRGGKIGAVDPGQLDGAFTATADRQAFHQHFRTDTAQVGDGAGNAEGILEVQPRGKTLLFRSVFLVFLQLAFFLLRHRLDNDVVGAEQLHLLQDLLLCALADCQHGNDRGNAKNDPQ